MDKTSDTPIGDKVNPVVFGDKPLEYPKEAYHDPETGMYVVPEAKKNESGFEEITIASDESKEPARLFVPVPTSVEVRFIRFENQTQIEVAESYDGCKLLIDEAMENGVGWFEFTDPAFGTRIAIPGKVLATATCVIDGWKDLEQVKIQLEQAEYAKREWAKQNIGKRNGIAPFRR